MLKIEDNEIVVRLRLDRPVDERQAATLARQVAEEMEFADREAGHYTKSGWGIGCARVIVVEQLLPGDLAGIEDAEMLAVRLADAGATGFAERARNGASRAELLEAVLKDTGPDPELVTIVIGRPPAP